MTSTDFQHQNEAICCHSMVSTNLCVSKSKSCSFQLILLMEANDLHKQTRSLHEAAFCCQLFLQHLKFQCLQEHLNYKSRLYRKCFFGCCQGLSPRHVVSAPQTGSQPIHRNTSHTLIKIQKRSTRQCFSFQTHCIHSLERFMTCMTLFMNQKSWHIPCQGNKTAISQ